MPPVKHILTSLVVAGCGLATTMHADEPAANLLEKPTGVPAETVTEQPAGTQDPKPDAAAAGKPKAAESQAPKPDATKPFEPLPSRGSTPDVRGLDDGNSPAQPVVENPLDSAVAGMRSATRRLQDKQTDEDTRKIQEQVVSDLQKLIDLAEQSRDSQKPPPQSPPQSPPMGDSQQKQDPSQQRQPQNGQPQPQSPQPQPADSQPEGQGGGQQTAETKQESDASRNSTEETREAEAAAARMRREALNQGVWGHLPPSVRQKLMSLGGDKVLPRYDDLARRYFESLAEQNRRARDNSGQ